jgi:hypothetical protein
MNSSKSAPSSAGFDDIARVSSKRFIDNERGREARSGFDSKETRKVEEETRLRNWENAQRNLDITSSL